MPFKPLIVSLFLSAAWLPAIEIQAQDIPTPIQPGGAEKDPNEINRLKSPDGPEVESRLHGSSELTGVLVDRTLTVVGRNFYRAFSQIAMERPIIGGATLTIHERPDARWGVQVWITEGTQVYFRTQLSPRLNDANDDARQAIDIVEKALLRRRLSNVLNPSADLGAEEF